MPGVHSIDLSLWVAKSWKRGLTLSAGICKKKIHVECWNKAGSTHINYLSFPNAVLSVDTRSLWVCLEHSCLVVSRGTVWSLCYSLFASLSDIYGFFLFCVDYKYAMTHISLSIRNNQSIKFKSRSLYSSQLLILTLENIEVLFFLFLSAFP